MVTPISEEAEEDAILRETVMEGIFKAYGKRDLSNADLLYVIYLLGKFVASREDGKADLEYTFELINK